MVWKIGRWSPTSYYEFSIANPKPSNKNQFIATSTNQANKKHKNYQQDTHPFQTLLHC